MEEASCKFTVLSNYAKWVSFNKKAYSENRYNCSEVPRWWPDYWFLSKDLSLKTMFLSGIHSHFIGLQFSQIEILQESRMMIPDCQRRLEVAHADLTQLLVSIIP